MKLWTVLICGCALAAAAQQAVNQQDNDRGRRQEVRSCVACHSLRLVDSQRLSRATWSKELDKMAKWGSQIQDREVLLDYLAKNYGDDRPATPDGISGDGSHAAGHEKR